MLKFKVKNQIITRTDDFCVVADSKNYLTAEFEFSEEWNKNIIAIFGYKDNFFHVEVKENQVTVPWEVIKSPYFSVSLFCGDLITANEIRVKVIGSGLKNGEFPSLPTPTVFQQIFDTEKELTSEIAKINESIATKANAEDVPTGLADLKANWKEVDIGNVDSRRIADLLTNETFNNTVDELPNGFYRIRAYHSSGGGGDHVKDPDSIIPIIPEEGGYTEVDWDDSSSDEDAGISTQTVIDFYNFFTYVVIGSYYQYLQFGDDDANGRHTSIYQRKTVGSYNTKEWKKINTTADELSSEVAKINESIDLKADKTELENLNTSLEELEDKVDTKADKTAIPKKLTDLEFAVKIINTTKEDEDEDTRELGAGVYKVHLEGAEEEIGTGTLTPIETVNSDEQNEGVDPALTLLNPTSEYYLVVLNKFIDYYGDLHYITMDKYVGDISMTVQVPREARTYQYKIKEENIYMRVLGCTYGIVSDWQKISMTEAEFLSEFEKASNEIDKKASKTELETLQTRIDTLESEFEQALDKIIELQESVINSANNVSSTEESEGTE